MSWRNLLFIIIVIVLVGFFILGSVFNWFGMGGDKIIGSGNIITKDVEVSDFNNISLAGMGNLIIKQGNQESLKIEAEDNIMDEIVAEVKGDTLDINYKRNWLFSLLIKPTKDINFYINLKDINKINISGSGTAQSENIKTDNMDIIINGSGEIDLSIEAETLKSNVSGSGSFNLSGKVDFQEMIISGSGKYFAKELESKKAVIKISGSGKTEINAKEELDVNISGSGTVFYVGDPKITQKISGSGKLEQIQGPTLSKTRPIIQGWRTYRSDSLGFIVDYPSEMNILSEGDGVKFLVLGPTQREGTEMFDGIMFSLFKRLYNQETLLEFIEEQRQADMDVASVEEIEEFILMDMNGYSYITEGLGTFTNIFIDVGENETLHISYFAPDPGDLGFQQTVDNMLSSLELLK